MKQGSAAPAAPGRAADTAAIQRRTVQTLLVSQIYGGVGQVSGVSVTVLLADQITGSKTLATMAAACLSIGSAAATFPLARLMSRSGRRPGLSLGYLVGAAGAFLAVIAAWTGFFPLLPFGIAAMGVASAANLATRYAAADLAAPERRASTIGLIVWASTLGSGFGSLISLSMLDPAGRALGLPDYGGSYSAAVLLFLAASAVIHFRLRPDPLIVAGGVQQGTQPRLPFTEAMGLILAHPRARLAVLGMMISQATMVGTMSLTPLHMKEGRQGGGAISLMLFTHIMGMYLFSPLVGRVTDRVGRYPVLMAAGVLCTAGAITAALTPPDGFVGVVIGLGTIGLAWSCGIIAASGLLTESFPVAQRASIQGAGDMCMAAFGAIAGVSAGGIVTLRSYHDLNLGAATLGLVLVAAVALTTARGRTRTVSAAGA